MEILEVEVCYPMNAIGGLYILIKGSRDEIYGCAANHLAIKTANEKGWKGEGKATVGMPCKEGVLSYTKAYWFHEKK